MKRLIVPIINIGIFIQDGCVEILTYKNTWRLLLFPFAFSYFGKNYDVCFNVFKKWRFQVWKSIKKELRDE